MWEKLIFNKTKDKVGIVAPSSGAMLHPNETEEENTKRAYQILGRGEKLYMDKGFQCMHSSNIFGNRPYWPITQLAANDSIRLENLVAYLTNPDIKIMHTYRGGYGLTAIHKHYFNNIKPVEQVLIGFCDITPLHVFFFKHGIYSIYARNLVQVVEELEQGRDSLNPILEVLGGKNIEVPIAHIQGSFQNPKPIKGKLFGGNLTLLCNIPELIRDHELNNSDQEKILKLGPKVLVLDDVRESTYEIDRYLALLDNTHVLEQFDAIIFGPFDYVSHLDVLTTRWAKKLPNIPFYRLAKPIEEYVLTIGADVKIEDGILEVYNEFTFGFTE